MKTRTALWAAPLVAFVTLVAAPAAAQAAPPPIYGYVWGWQPANPNYISATGYEYNSAGGPVQIIRPAVGTYQVRFHGMAGTGGVAHASAYGANHICTISSYGPSGADEIVNVRCYTTAGALVDTRFVANITNRQEPGSFGFLWNDDPTPPVGGHIPPAQWSYDSTGQPIVVYRSGVGEYQIKLGAFAQDSPGLWANGYLRATAYGASAKHCQVLDPDLFPDPSIIQLRCYDDTGFGIDTRFTLTYARKTMLSASATVDLTGPIPVLDGWSNTAGGAPVVTELGVGSYQISFPNAGIPRGHAIGTIMGTPPMFCNIQAWWPSAGAENLRVSCFDPGGGAANPAVLLNVGFFA